VGDEYFVFYGDALADEGVALYFAALSDIGVFLDLYKGADPGVIADGAPIQVDEVLQYDVFSENDIGCDFFGIKHANFSGQDLPG
jgi:hypothetical protein